ncbi:MAG TPA: succinate dehydrogenase [Bacillota bacterium]|nr:succinate dehydrogenase [Bacillota bacterium]
MEFANTLQTTLNKKANPKTDMYIDIAESVSGVLLVGFLWMHMLFVATIVLGEGVFNTLSEGLDKYYLAQIGIPATVLLIIFHIFVAGRRAPMRLRDLRIAWRLTKGLNHFDTWIWVGQVITALLIGIFASMHLWTIMSTWPITALKSAHRVADPGTAFWGGFKIAYYFWFYIIFLIVGEYHAGFGLYRVLVKWGWFERHKMGYILKAITVIIVALGFTALFVFKKVAGGAL